MARKKKTVEEKLAIDLIDGDISYKGEEVTIEEIKEAIEQVEADKAAADPEKKLVGYHPITKEPVYI